MTQKKRLLAAMEDVTFMLDADKRSKAKGSN
jgi:hypothetical protein